MPEGIDVHPVDGSVFLLTPGRGRVSHELPIPGLRCVMAPRRHASMVRPWPPTRAASIPALDNVNDCRKACAQSPSHQESLQRSGALNCDTVIGGSLPYRPHCDIPQLRHFDREQDPRTARRRIVTEDLRLNGCVENGDAQFVPPQGQ